MSAVNRSTTGRPHPAALSRRLLALLSLLLLSGCEWPGQPKPADRHVPPQEVLTFDVLFKSYCTGCHGADGKLGPAPPLNDRLFLALVPDAELQRLVTEGRPGTLMPAFATSKGGHLTAQQVKILAEGIKPRWGPGAALSGAPPLMGAPPQPDRVSTANKEAGIKVFARACASCHGDQGQGGRYGGTPDGRPVGAINDPDFLALLSDQALRRYVITGRPDLGMPDYADPKGRPEGFKALTAQEVADVVALLASWRQSGSLQRKGE